MRTGSSPRIHSAALPCSSRLAQHPLNMPLSASIRCDGVDKCSTEKHYDSMKPSHRELAESAELQRQVKLLTEQLAAETAGRHKAVAALTLAEQRAEERAKEAASSRREAEVQAERHTRELRSSQVQLAAQTGQLADLSLEKQALESQAIALQAQMREVQEDQEQALQASLQHMDEQLESLRRQHAEVMEDLVAECHQEMVKRQALAKEIKDLRQQRKAQDSAATQESAATLPSSEGRLRIALTRAGSTTDELRSAILAVESLTAEARRELSARELRERRAAYESLHIALERGIEEGLVQAIEQARCAGVDAEDIDKAIVSLEALQALSVEERATKSARERAAKSKEHAFLLVKRDDAAALRELLGSLDLAGIEWRAWKDHARRTLLQCSRSLRSAKARDFLEAMVEVEVSSVQRGPSEPVSLHIDARPQDATAVTWGSIAKAAVSHVVESPQHRGTAEARFGEEGKEDAVAAEIFPEAALPCGVSAGVIGSDVLSPEPAPETTPEAPEAEESLMLAFTDEEQAELRAKAFRAVVKDDTKALAEVIYGLVPLTMWRRWENKGGKDLLTLSEERGSKAAYSMLAKALGLLKERKRESYEEREAVWVFFGGDVQPRRATVMEDTAADADEIFLEFWDGDEPPMRIGRDFVLKAAC